MSAKEKVNILLVDDQPAKLLSYEAILSPLGENLIKTRSGREALEQLLKNDIAVVLVDVCMPELDGFELASMIRQHPRHQRAAIIFVSAVHMTDMDRLRGYESGGVDYVAVPIVPEILQARVSVFADLYRKTIQLERLNTELERRVSERTSALEASTARLRDSEEALRQTDRRKDEFLAMLAHELRNPLAPIRNAAKFLRLRGSSDDGLRWCQDVVDRQVEHLTRLIDDLLDVSRITRGKLEIRTERVALNEVVLGAVETVHPFADQKRQNLHVTMPSEAIYIDADVVRMTQVFMNLLDNAVKYTPEAGAILLTAEPENGSVVVRVRDTGLGISADEIPYLFQMFYQTSTTRSQQGGLGIGLALVRRLVELHGGTVEAKSEGTNKGTEFAVRLPVSKAPVPRPARSSADDGAEIAPPHRILVVDDNHDSAESLAMLLRVTGNEVETAHDGMAAVETAENFKPEVVLLDIGMPLLDGYDTASRMRKQPWGENALLIAVTGWGQEEDRRRSREAGFDAHLTKPVSHAELVRLLKTLPGPPQPIGG